MLVRLRHLLGWVFSVFRSREELLLENSPFGNNGWPFTQSDLVLDRVPSTNCSGSFCEGFGLAGRDR
jgi:hypothetical protein